MKTLCIDRTCAPKPHAHLGPRAAQQRGDALIESLLAILLAAVIGLGLSYAASRMLSTQRMMSAQNMAHQQVREGLMRAGFSAAKTCTTAGPHTDALTWSASAAYTKDGGTIPMTLNCHAAKVRINGVEVSLNTIESVQIGDGGDNSLDLFGGNGKLMFTASEKSQKSNT